MSPELTLSEAQASIDPVPSKSAAALDHVNQSAVRQAGTERLREFATEIRSFLIQSIATTGGHIGANLGTVELTLALHHVFETPRDTIFWDTGHQGYTHKIITGRSSQLSTLNTPGGINRFVSSRESEHDSMEASHAGTAVSVALGTALARRKASKGWAIAVVGDGSLSEGLTLEALNHAAVETEARLMIVINDNGFAISPGFGGIHEYLQRLQPGHKSSEKFFSSLGFEYFGPIDGHDLEALVPALQAARQSAKIPVIHAKTVKGQGFRPADSHPYRLHFSFPYDPEDGSPLDEPGPPGYQEVAAKKILEVMESDPRVVAITPSTIYATGLQRAFDRYPDRCFDPGMEEQHAMSLSVGFAREGFKPILFYQSTFMQRAFDQLLHDVCFANFPTLILCVRSGFAGYDNPTHHGIYDFSYLGGLPNLRILYPKDRYELWRMIGDEMAELAGPTLIAMPYGPMESFDPAVLNESRRQFGLPQLVEPASQMMIATVGNKYAESRQALVTLRNRGIDCGLINLRYLKPLPEKWLLEQLAAMEYLVSVEESVLEGGVGSALASLIADHELPCRLLRIGLPTTFVEPGTNHDLCRAYGLDAAGINRRIIERWPHL